MRITGASIFFCAAVAILSVIPCRAAEKMAVEGTMTFYSMLEYGTENMPSGKWHMRNRETIFYVDTSDSRIMGYFRLVGNVNLDSEGTGVEWGSIYSCDADGNPDGLWEGTWEGQIFSFYPWNAMDTFLLHGKGENEGLQVEWFEVGTNSWMNPLVGLIQDSDKD